MSAICHTAQGKYVPHPHLQHSTHKLNIQKDDWGKLYFIYRCACPNQANVDVTYNNMHEHTQLCKHKLQFMIIHKPSYCPTTTKFNKNEKNLSPHPIKAHMAMDLSTILLPDPNGTHTQSEIHSCATMHTHVSMNTHIHEHRYTHTLSLSSKLQSTHTSSCLPFTPKHKHTHTHNVHTHTHTMYTHTVHTHTMYTHTMYTHTHTHTQCTHTHTQCTHTHTHTHSSKLQSTHTSSCLPFTSKHTHTHTHTHSIGDLPAVLSFLLLWLHQ